MQKCKTWFFSVSLHLPNVEKVYDKVLSEWWCHRALQYFRGGTATQMRKVSLRLLKEVSYPALSSPIQKFSPSHR